MDLDKIIKFDKYTWRAKIFPTLLSLVPLFIFQYLYFENLIFKWFKGIENYSSVFHIILIGASLFISVEITRSFGKNLIEEYYFIRNNKFPSTQILLNKNKIFSQQFLKNIKSKIRKDFNLDINVKGKEKILRVKDAVNQIIAKVGYKHQILNNYNISYGFFRNLTGGFLIYLLSTLLLIGFSYFDNLIIFYASILLLLGEIIFLISSWRILNNHGTKYAKQLFNVYMSEAKK